MIFFYDMKRFENDNKDKSIAHFQEKNDSFCTVTIDVPDEFEKGIIFIGLFRTLIPNHMPISGLATKKFNRKSIEKYSKWRLLFISLCDKPV